MRRIKLRTIRFLEFLFIGVVFGIIEDLLAIALATDSKIDFRVIFIVFLVALPFAFISEYVVDHPKFWKTIFRGNIEERIHQVFASKSQKQEQENITSFNKN